MEHFCIYAHQENTVRYHYTVSDIQPCTVQLQTLLLFISSSLACRNSSYPYAQLRRCGATNGVTTGLSLVITKV